MGVANTIRKVLIDRHISITKYADIMDKPRSTVANTLFKDSFQVSTLLEYMSALNCEVVIRDKENGTEYIL